MNLEGHVNDIVNSSTIEQAGPFKMLVTSAGVEHRLFKIVLDESLNVQGLLVKRERGHMVDAPVEVGKGSATRLAMLPQWQSDGWDDWVQIEPQTHELDAPAFVSALKESEAGLCFLEGRVKEKKPEPVKIEKQTDKILALPNGDRVRLSVERGEWAVYWLSSGNEECGEWIGTVKEPTSEACEAALEDFFANCE